MNFENNLLKNMDKNDGSNSTEEDFSFFYFNPSETSHSAVKSLQKIKNNAKCEASKIMIDSYIQEHTEYSNTGGQSFKAYAKLVSHSVLKKEEYINKVIDMFK
ncbi:arginine utilization protein RocB [Chryseobacterium sp. H1D6B]|uniref:hypothetical protein n=1 Tax=Chryseobacterium sp. H1D6B TaxID=2940588 RepID=UPI0015CD5264|nr:hypothetical protein [Chryseobacterium sp. H1D6B]MDH6253827.1 arginine utilization protein RocB [Chryseobacterium sp. H1D6B]